MEATSPHYLRAPKAERFVWGSFSVALIGLLLLTLLVVVERLDRANSLAGFASEAFASEATLRVDHAAPAEGCAQVCDDGTLSW
jgi:hypothetical protein